MAVVSAPKQADSYAGGADWHLLDPAQAQKQLDVTAETGLDSDQVKTRQAQYGLNELEEGKTKGPWKILWEQLTQPLVLLLIGAAAISALLGKLDSFIAISGIVVLNAVLGLVQEYRAEKAMAALKKMAAPLVRVRRKNGVQDIEARQLVPGDVLLLEAGNIIPADARVIEAVNLRVEEASLTGESQPVDKHTRELQDPLIPLGDRRNMVYMGTSVTYGRGTAVVVHTGMKTELGKIATLIQGVHNEQTPLQRRMGEMGRVMIGAALVIMVIAFLIGLWRGESLSEILLTSVAIAVAVVPEGLPAVVTISLALGTQRMLRRRALIRKLPAVETLGSVTVICSDKTGTLTENRMAMKVIDVAGRTVSLDITPETAEDDPTQTIILTAGSLCNDAILTHEGDSLKVIGDPTEGAFLTAASRFGLDKNKLEQAFPRVGEVPFSSERKRMTTIHRLDHARLNGFSDSAVAQAAQPGEMIAFTKGAVDSLLQTCDRVWIDSEILPMTEEHLHRIEAANNRLAEQGLRVLGLAFHPVVDQAERTGWESEEAHMIFVGLVGIIDPPRPEVKTAVETCKKAGIRAVMITGDHPLTAQAIAREIGITNEGDRVVTGVELAQMSDEALEDIVETVSVYARVAPEHKLRIVRALQKKGHIAAMTGDGVNDAPALKQADIGVAMSITGTDVSKEAADMVLLDDNFATIVSAVEEGRTIYDNVRRFVKYLLASNTGELFVLLATQLIAGMTLPLTTLQILWMNLITDGVPALALGIEKAEKNAMNRAPYEPNESIFGRGLGRHILLVGLLLGVTSLALGYWAWSNNIAAANGAPAWNTMVFLTLTLAQMGHALGVRSHRESLFTMGLMTNKALLGAVILTLVLQMIAIYTPFFNTLFLTNPLTLEQLVLCLVLSTVVFWGVELEKLLIRRGVLR